MLTFKQLVLYSCLLENLLCSITFAFARFSRTDSIGEHWLDLKNYLYNPKSLDELKLYAADKIVAVELQ